MPMDFMFCTDKNYLKGYGVLMLSILHYAPPPVTERLRFHVLSDDLDDADKAALKSIAARRENTQVFFYAPERMLSPHELKSINATLKEGDWVTKEAYYRFAAADLIPPDARRALYIDGDALCTGSLEGVFDADLRGCPCGMCVDVFSMRLDYYNRLSYPPKDAYFCSGVILFDLDAWRKQNLKEAVFGWLEANAKKALFHDQDAINGALHGRIFPLDFSYNVSQNCFNVFYWIQEEKNKYYASGTQFLPKEQWPALLAAVKRPRLVHFLANPKPWHTDCEKPFADMWRYFYAQSPWKDEKLGYKNLSPFKAKIKRLLGKRGRSVLEKLHIVARLPATAIPYPAEAWQIARKALDELLEEDRALKS